MRTFQLDTKTGIRWLCLCRLFIKITRIQKINIIEHDAIRKSFGLRPLYTEAWVKYKKVRYEKNENTIARYKKYVEKL